MKTPILETARLILRPVTLDDAPAIQKYFNNWEIIKNMSTLVPWPYPDDGAVTWLQSQLLPKIETGEVIGLAITEKNSKDELIGIIHFRSIPDHNGTHRGFWLAQPFWNRGYMTEAVEAAQDFIFFELDWAHLIITNAAYNKGSRRIKEKTGAVYLGTCEIAHHNGDNISEKWEVTRENWARIRGRSADQR
jgi:[ribosomal protein S5]-alanine N-acetyltransferase